MGNAPSAAHAVHRSGPQDLETKQASKSWATPDHTLSGPWNFIVKEHVQCLCEGGRNCTKENPARQKRGDIPGLHCNWVGQHVLAMARPWQEHVIKFDLVSKFKEHNIGMILNLQEVGEHDSCGPGNLPKTGFTYDFESFTNAGVMYCNMSWRDMGVPTLDKMMDIVQIMHHTTAVEKKKIAVHCHAGLGRTGLSIACFLVFHGEASATQAVELVRQQRPGAVQTKAQVLFVSIFEQYLQHLRCLFKVADLRQLHLGNENYILTKVSRQISRSLSSNSYNAPSDPMAAASAALNIIGVTNPDGSTGTKIPATLTDGTAADWTTASFDQPLTAEEAAKIPSAAESAANAALDLSKSENTSGILVQHAKRQSGGGGMMKLVSNLKAIKEDPDRPVHVIETDNAVTEVYGSGLTIIRSARSAKELQTVQPRHSTEQLLMDRFPTTSDLGLDLLLPWNEKFYVKPEAYVAEGWLPESPTSYQEALKRQQRLLHGVERRQSLRLHKLMKAAAKSLAKGCQAYNSVGEHWDASASSGTGPTLRKMHSRSRSSTAADILALTASLSSSPSGGGTLRTTRTSSSGGGSQSPASPIKGPSVHSSTGGAASLLPPHIHFGAPSCSTTSGNRRLSRCTSNQCLAGCCAPGFAAGLLAALLYKGRFPDEYRSQWSLCPRLQSLGFADGGLICSQLHTVKLGLNSGDYGPLEAASPAIAITVLGDWFDGFKAEALAESTLELLIDDADQLLAEAVSAAEARHTALRRISDGASAEEQQVQQLEEDSDKSGLARRAAARAVCCALTALEQDLFLLLAAVLRHVRLASIDDSRLEAAVSGSNSSSNAAAAQQSGAPHKDDGLQQGVSQTVQLASMSEQQQVVDDEVDGAMIALYRIVASWLLGPLAVACPAALDAVHNFLHYLTLDDIAYSQLLHATREQGIKRCHSQPSSVYFSGTDSPRSRAGSTDSLERLLTNDTTPATPRSQLKSRLVRGIMQPGSGGPSNAKGSSGTGSTVGKSKLGHTVSSPQLSKKAGQQADKQGCSDPSEFFLNHADGVTSVVATSKGGKRVQIQMAVAPMATAQEPVAAQPQKQAAPKQTVRHRSESGSSSSQLILEGSSHLCVGRQKERSSSNMVEELADLAGKPQLQQLDAAELTGAMISPPRSSSPVPPTGAKSSTGGRQYHLPPVKQSGSGAGTATGRAASPGASPLNSEQFAPGQLSATPSAMPSNLDVASSQMLSMSMMSEIALPSFASNVSVGDSMTPQGRMSTDNFTGVLGQSAGRPGPPSQ